MIRAPVSRIDRLKRSIGTAVRRSEPSRAAEIIVASGRVHGRVLDYGCGYGVDPDHFGWDGFDPYYRPRLPEGPYDTVVCTLVLNVLSRNNRSKVIGHIQRLLAPGSAAYLAVARDLPRTGKMGIRHSLINYVVLNLPLLFEDQSLAIYELGKGDSVEDLTTDFISRRDARRDR